MTVGSGVGTGGAQEYLAVVLERFTCVFPARLVVEIRAVPDLTPPATTGQAHVGSMTVQGRSVAVFDLRALLGLTPWRRLPTASALVVLSHGAGPDGPERALLVDRVSEILALSPAEIVAERPEVMPASLVLGLARRAESLVVLDGEAVIAACADPV